MPIGKLYLIVAGFLCAACIPLSVPAKADWDDHHHHHHGYWHDDNDGDDYPRYYYAPPVYYYPPPRQVYYYAPAYRYPVYEDYEPAPAYFMGVPIYGLGFGLNIHIR